MLNKEIIEQIDNVYKSISKVLEFSYGGSITEELESILSNLTIMKDNLSYISISDINKSKIRKIMNQILLSLEQFKSKGLLSEISFIKNSTLEIIELIKIGNDSYDSNNHNLTIKYEVDKLFSSIKFEQKEFRRNLQVLKKELKETENRLNGLFTDWQTQIFDSKDENNKKFTDFLKEKEKEFILRQENFLEEGYGKIDQIEKTIGNLIESKEEELKSNLELIKNAQKDIEAKRVRICELYELAANDSVRGSYEKTFTQETSNADRFRFWGIIIFLIAVGWCVLLALYFIFCPKGDISIIKFIPGISVTFLLIIIASYLVSQSSKHRDIANWAKQMELEITVIDPFITNLSDEQKAELKKELSRKIFGAIEKPSSSSSRFSNKEIKLLTKILDIFRRDKIS